MFEYLLPEGKQLRSSFAPKNADNPTVYGSDYIATRILYVLDKYGIEHGIHHNHLNSWGGRVTPRQSPPLLRLIPCITRYLHYSLHLTILLYFLALIVELIISLLEALLLLGGQLTFTIRN